MTGPQRQPTPSAAKSFPAPTPPGVRRVIEPGLTRRQKTFTALATGVAAAGALAYVGIADPHNRHSVFPVCPFKLLTGWNCPACGGLRMAHDLVHANLSAAVADNVFLLAGIPALLAWFFWRRSAGKPPLTRGAVVVAIAAAVAWTVVRNLPGFPLVPTLYGG